jgi:branched-chain amino acid transport system ATP-binding protein
MSALAVENVSLNFGGLQALKEISLHVAMGERQLLIGPNGAGKTTLFNVISGVLRSATGVIRVFGQDVVRLDQHERARLGIARTFQIINLFPRLTVVENVRLALQASPAHRHESLAALTARTMDVLAAWQLADRAQQRITELSYGDQRQVDLMIALSGAPRLLLLDEPLSGLSAAESAQVVGRIQALPRDIAVVMIEHDMSVALGLADRVSVLHLGRLIAEGTSAEVQANAEVQAIYLGQDG